MIVQCFFILSMRAACSVTNRNIRFNHLREVLQNVWILSKRIKDIFGIKTMDNIYNIYYIYWVVRKVRAAKDLNLINVY